MTPERRPGGEDGLLEVRDPLHVRRAGAAGGRVREERPDHDQVVEDRREHRRGEPPVRLEEPDDDRADAVEDDLGHEPSEEEDPELDLCVAVAGVRRDEVQTDDLLREQRTEGGDDDGDHRHQRDHAVRHLPGILGAVGLDARDEDRDEDRREDPSEDQLVDDVRREVGDRVDGAQRADGDAERRRHRGESEEPREAGERGADRHHGGAPHQRIARVPRRPSSVPFGLTGSAAGTTSSTTRRRGPGRPRS